MDENTQNIFDAIVQKAPEALFASDIEFLKARESYLSEADRQRFADALGFNQPKPSKAKKDSATDGE